MTGTASANYDGIILGAGHNSLILHSYLGMETERTFPNMRHGDLLVGAFAGNQVGYNRPFPGAGHYRAHVKGLYLCGSSCHPGGNITGLPGYNCAQVILSDLGLPAPWAPPSAEEQIARIAS